MTAKLQQIASTFALDGKILSIKPLGDGFINDTFIIRTEGDAPDYILQRKNQIVFPDVPAMMDNIDRVTAHIRKRVIADGGDPTREVMTIIPTHDGKFYHIDEDGEYWAVCVFIDDTTAYNAADSEELARMGGVGIGKFQAQLADFNEPLAEVIKGFHNIKHRFVQWDEALAQDLAGRKASLAKEIEWIES
ncbi:MAG: phosphotransferase, partial [Alistipes sp.]|nr:phosphotransferase [Alistipes sp.]